MAWIILGFLLFHQIDGTTVPAAEIDDFIAQAMLGLDHKPNPFTRSANEAEDEEDEVIGEQSNSYGGYSRHTELSDEMDRRNQVFKKVVELSGNKTEALDVFDAALFRFDGGRQLCPNRPRCSFITRTIRTLDGTCNNMDEPTWGSTGIAFLRYLEPGYADKKGIPRGGTEDTGKGGRTPSSVSSSCIESRDRALPSPRVITRKFHLSRNQSSSTHSDMLMQVGQFLDHDISLTPLSRVRGDCCRSRDSNCFPYSIPNGDPTFRNCFSFMRSLAHCEDPRKVREQLNAASAFVDGSQIYGDTVSKSNSLRQRSRGSMRISNDGFSLHPTIGFGDSRGTSHPMLISMHTLFIREHNRIVRELAELDPNMARNDETTFQLARKIIIAQWQNIVYSEYLPQILGPSSARKFDLGVSQRTIYDPKIDPSLRNDFSTAAYRFGHSQVQDSYKQMDTSRAQSFSDIRLKDEFFKDRIVEEDGGRGVNRIIDGLMERGVQNSDRFFSETITETLFGAKLDLVSINIQRGRDHGIPSYNEYRRFCGLSPACSWSQSPREISSEDWKILSGIYKSPSDIDFFVGGMAEEPFEGGVLGRTFNCIVGRQFAAIKDGDRFFFSHRAGNGVADALSDAEFETISKRTLGDIICDNTEVKTVKEEVMVLSSSPKCCHQRNALDLTAFLASRP